MKVLEAELLIRNDKTKQVHTVRVFTKGKAYFATSDSLGLELADPFFLGLLATVLNILEYFEHHDV